jgi:hypothetical protein
MLDNVADVALVLAAGHPFGDTAIGPGFALGVLPPFGWGRARSSDGG